MCKANKERWLFMYEIEKATQNLTANELTEFSRQFNKRSKKVYKAYILWALGGFLGLHRFYTGNLGTGLILLVVTVFTCGLGAIAGWYDVVNIKRLVNEANKELTLQIIKDVKRK
jgi:TM2 domain-containing membrane protein YozV